MQSRLFVDKTRHCDTFRRMNQPLKEFLTYLIKQNYISVFNDESGSEYAIPAPMISATVFTPGASMNNLDALDEDDFILSCQYILDGNIPSGLYTLKYGDMILESAKTPVLSHPTSQTARDLISLARACSQKIIAQQKMAQQRNMIMGMNSNYGQHTN